MDFQPEIFINNIMLDVVEESKLLGVILSSDLKWAKNVAYIVTRAMTRLWILRRIKELGGTTDDLLVVYKLQIRCLTELACPAWNGALTVKDIKKLENIQKMALKVILGKQFKTYEDALETLKLDKLETRRKQLCLSFATKTAKNLKYSSWFQLIHNNTRSGLKYYVPVTRTTSYERSPLIYLANLLNHQS